MKIKNSTSTDKAYFLKLGYTVNLTFIAMVLYRISYTNMVA